MNETKYIISFLNSLSSKKWNYLASQSFVQSDTAVVTKRSYPLSHWDNPSKKSWSEMREEKNIFFELF